MDRIIGQLYGLDDYIIIPEVSTDVKSRTKECLPKYANPQKYGITNDRYPIFAAPMSCVVDENNWKEFVVNGITPVIPRTVDYNIRLSLMKDTFVAMSLKEFQITINDTNNFNTTSYICVDIANGHMSCMMEECKKAKIAYGDKIIIMAGNIANPKTYDLYAKAGIDYIRLGIGSGNVCFVDGTKITMADGTKKNIEDVQVNERVLTHSGIGTVVERFRHKTNKNTVTINDEITCTANHEFYVINKDDKDKVNEDNLSDFAFWIAAGNLDKDKHLLIKKYS